MIRRWSGALGLATCGVVAFLSATLHAEGGVTTHPSIHNGYSRPYLVYTPAHLSPRAAVVFMLGGTGSSATENSKEFRWAEEAEKGNFLVVFPELVPRRPDQPFAKQTNTTFWEMKGSRTHVPPPGKLPVDDDGYLMDVLRDVLHHQPVNPNRVFFAGFSSGSGMVQLFASRHPESVTAIAAVATPLMDPPVMLARPVSVLYIHGDDDEMFSGFEVNSPNFATTPQGNWVTWGYLNGCHIQRAKKMAWGVQFSWEGCRRNTAVVARFVAQLGHEWVGSRSSTWIQNHPGEPEGEPLDFTQMAWEFFAAR
jgi:polyhydroxybutyrate depolymerase